MREFSDEKAAAEHSGIPTEILVPIMAEVGVSLQDFIYEICTGDSYTR